MCFTYDAANRRTSKTLPNGIVATYTYDEASLLTGITYSQGATVLGTLTYGHDLLGRRTSVGGSWARTTLPSPVTAAYDAANQLTRFGTAPISYDAAGQLTTDGTHTYEWDGRHQLSSIDGGATGSFGYDGFGRREQTTLGGTTTRYLYGGANAVQEQTSGGTPTANLLTGGVDEIFPRTDTLGTTHPLGDAQGSTLAASDGTGAVGTTFTYGAFGETTASGASGLRAQYTGRENDNTGLYYYRARYYAPALQRFISEDPLDFGGGNINLYGYAGNDPTNVTDPSGKCPMCITALVGAGVGAAAGAFWAYENSGNVWHGALDGAIAGGVTGVTMGLAGPAVAGAFGGGMVGGAAAGAFANAIGNLAEQGFENLAGRQCGINWGSVGLGGGFGAAFGLVALRPSTAANQLVTSWASNGIVPDLNQGRWAMTGGDTLRNWLLSGLSGTFDNSISGTMPGNSLAYPSGWEAIKGLFGQRIIQ